MKKLSLLLASLGAAALFVGGTFAAYVITDNANPIGKKISPSEITDDKIGNITLEWGENTIANVGNLGAGATAKMGNIVLKASGKDADNLDISTYAGTLNMKLTDLTKYGDTEPANKLIDFLEVDVVPGDVSLETWVGKTAEQQAADRIGHIPPTPGVYAFDAAATGTAAGSTYSVFVKLSDSATPVYTTISTQVVYLQLDWNANQNDSQVAETTKVFFQKPASGWTGDKVYVYAWKDGVQNAAFPGVEMKSEGGRLYSFELAGSSEQGKDKFGKVIFSDYSSSAQEHVLHQTADIALDYSKQYYVCGAVGEDGKYACTSSATAPVELAAYYVTGVINGVDKWYTTVGFVSDLAMSTENLEHGDKGKLSNITLKAGDQLCVIANDGATYYHAQGGGNFVIEADGAYDIYLNANSEVWAVPHA